MIKIAIVEDEKLHADILEGFIKEYSEREDLKTNVTVFEDGATFLDKYQSVYDLVFLDIRMPNIDGMRAAEKLRELDSTVQIVFVTNLGDYAVKGYGVNARGFIKKPLSYAEFESNMKRVVQYILLHDENVFTIHSGLVKHRIRIRDLMYVEVLGHICTFHTTEGDIEGRNSLRSVAKELEKYQFLLCSSSLLVNPVYIQSVNVKTVTVAGKEMELSRLKRKEFMLRFNAWLAKDGEL